ncbi:hypothetical protein JAAARDRAFT_325957 [Jaapia argillacea MUCL 33604]|uniref:F-box domain-containing protein n=1 Tax=Jaapia argillacea MUCL 33604 TaxID=933084 RepID=A0A067PZ96_9AGAM|nr:hypothetical protein JAAARDRAFT_325957 [Jaapia argillacea MUCL 33604]
MDELSSYHRFIEHQAKDPAAGMSLEQIDKNIYKHAKSLQQLAFRRNGLSPVSCLPPEILTRIFTLLASRPPSSQVLSKPRRYLWIRVVHVCRRWRRAAIGCPALWTRVVFSLPKWARAMLTLSKANPLVVSHRATRTSGQYPRSVKIVESALQHLQRIRQITLELPSSWLQRLFGTITDPSAPLLENLSVSISECHTIAPINKMFTLDAPSLHTLQLSNCVVEWDSRILHHGRLLSLQISFSLLAPTKSTATLSQLLPVLARNPNLQTLILRNVLPEASSQPETPVDYSPVHLSQLTSFELACEDSLTVVELARYLSIPASSYFGLTCRDASEGADPLLSFALPHCDPGLGGKEIRTVRLSGTSSGWFHIGCYPGLAEPSKPEGSKPIRRQSRAAGHLLVTCRFGENPFQEWSARFISRVFGTPGLTTLEHIHVERLPDLPSEVWRNLLRHQVHIHTIELSKCRATSFLIALNTRIGDGDTPTSSGGNEDGLGLGFETLSGSTPTHHLLPNLGHLSLEEIDFNDEGGGTTFSDALSTFLRSRNGSSVSNGGTALGSLTIRKCYNVSTEDVEHFRDVLVGTVDWDGVVKSGPDVMNPRALVYDPTTSEEEDF